MPDNGFGSRANSRSFLLRLYEVEIDWEAGDVDIEDWITLSDPRHEVPFEIVNEDTRDRLLTGGDFDIESVRADRRGHLWFGEEFGPYLLHTDRQQDLRRRSPTATRRTARSATPTTARTRRRARGGGLRRRHGRDPVAIDDPATMASLVDAGVDGIITDYPDRLPALMAERGLELPEPVRGRRSCRR